VGVWVDKFPAIEIHSQVPAEIGALIEGILKDNETFIDS
jgi:hypothetical protein